MEILEQMVAWKSQFKYIQEENRDSVRMDKQIGSADNFDRAVEDARMVVEATPYDHPDRAMYLNNLGNRLGNRYSRTGAMADLEEAIQVAREAVEATSYDHPNRAVYLNNLRLSLGDRYSRTGAMANLEESHKCFSTALNLDVSPVSTRITAGSQLLSSSTPFGHIHEAYQVAVTTTQLIPLLTPCSL